LCAQQQKLVKLVLPVENLMLFVRESGQRLHETIVRLIAVVSPQLRNHCQQGTGPLAGIEKCNNYIV
jgi:hypothetical protein